MLELIQGIAKCQKGATAVEYGLIVSLIVVAMLFGLGSFADASNKMWNLVTTRTLNASK
jgi:pilus assembly protein Flp/PilA